MKRKNRLNRAYTLMEIMVVLMVLGAMAAIAIPTFTCQIKKVNNREAIAALLAIYTAQLDYAKEHETDPLIPQYADDLKDLDVEFTPLKKFILNNSPLTGHVSCTFKSDDSLYLASMKANNDPYTLYVLKSGRVVCKKDNGGCTDGLCKKMGFGEF